MEYRRFGRMDWKVSALGFGAMRLPVIDRKQAAIDEPLAGRMIAYAVEHGVNYFDTAYGYHEGRSEPFVGRVLKEGGYRDKVKLATKMPIWLVETAADFDRYLNEQLQKLQTDHIDCYLLHGLNQRFWPKMRDLGVGNWAEGAVADGRIGHFGFSFHDDFDTFKDIIDTYDNWDICQIQYNFMDIEYQAGTIGLKYAADKGLAVVVMEPLRGGKFTKAPPQKIKDILEKAPRKRSLPEWALQWVLDQPEVSVALSGMSAMEHVEENCGIAAQSAKNALSAEEMEIIAQLRDAYKGLSPIPCTKCEYCMPCTGGINIPYVFDLYNEAFIYGDKAMPRVRYRQQPEEKWGNQCTECGACENMCPQHIEIIEWMKKVHAFLGPKPKA
ncbi:MAG: aldo/keto reductase [Deltaproteobacteria bacterium]|nr:aldo/keto reductase [Deltaproteobacteria bacterium]